MWIRKHICVQVGSLDFLDAKASGALFLRPMTNMFLTPWTVNWALPPNTSLPNTYFSLNASSPKTRISTHRLLDKCYLLNLTSLLWYELNLLWRHQAPVATSLLNLPSEILFAIVRLLKYDWNISALSQVNPRLYLLLNRYPCQHNQHYFQGSLLTWAANGLTNRCVQDARYRGHK